MHQNPLWKLFLLLIAGIVVGYTIFTGTKVYKWSTYNQTTKPQSLNWSIQRVADDDFALEGSYEFSWKGHDYEGKTIYWEQFLNSYAAQEAIKQLDKDKMTVWFNPSDPTKSDLNNDFPIKYALYDIVLWLLLAYFIWLGYSVGRYQ